MTRAACIFSCTIAIALGCSKSDGSNGPDAKTNAIAGTLSVDIRQSVDVTFSPRTTSASTTSGDFDGSLSFGDGDFQLFDAHTILRGTVVAEPLSEAQATMYTAIFTLPARASSVCADRPIDLALSLVRRGSNARVGGALTAYCGDGVTSGVPGRVYRLDGDLPLP